MSSILVLNSSVLGDASVSRVLVAETVQRLLQASPGSTVVERDLGSAPIPHLIPATVAGIRALPPRTLSTPRALFRMN
jgi:FMN-dependent NADH-azoreductase